MRNVGNLPCLPCNRDISSSGVAAKEEVPKALAKLEGSGVTVPTSLKQSIQCAVEQHQLTLVWDIIQSKKQQEQQQRRAAVSIMGMGY